MESLLLEFGGLPLHPLVVHAAVVFIPLAALLLIAGAIILRWRWLLPTAVLVSWVATAFSILASQSGEALGEVIGTPQEHGELGEAMSPLMIGMSLIATLTWWLRKRSSKLLRGLSQLASVVIALVALGLLVLSATPERWPRGMELSQHRRLSPPARNLTLSLRIPNKTRWRHLPVASLWRMWQHTTAWMIVGSLLTGLSMTPQGLVLATREARVQLRAFAARMQRTRLEANTEPGVARTPSWLLLK